MSGSSMRVRPPQKPQKKPLGQKQPPKDIPASEIHWENILTTPIVVGFVVAIVLIFFYGLAWLFVPLVLIVNTQVNFLACCSAAIPAITGIINVALNFILEFSKLDNKTD